MTTTHKKLALNTVVKYFLYIKIETSKIHLNQGTKQHIKFRQFLVIKHFEACKK